MKRLTPIFFVAGILFSSGGFAAPVTWTINNAVFDDGGAVSGTFDYDADTNSYSNIALLTTDGSSTFSGTTYLSSQSVSSASFFNSSTTLNDVGTGLTVFAMQFFQPLTNAGGAVALFTGDEYNSSFTLQRSLLGGATVSAVPVPAAVWLFGSALAGLGWMRRKQTI